MKAYLLRAMSVLAALAAVAIAGGASLRGI